MGVVELWIENYIAFYTYYLLYFLIFVKNLNINMADNVTRNEFSMLIKSVDEIKFLMQKTNDEMKNKSDEILKVVILQNSRVFNLEKNAAVHEAERFAKCPNREIIDTLRENMNFEMNRKKALDRSLKNTQLTVAIAVAVIARLTYFS